MEEIKITQGVKYLYSPYEIEGLTGGIFILENKNGTRAEQIAKILEKATGKKFIIQSAKVQTSDNHAGWEQF